MTDPRIEKLLSAFKAEHKQRYGNTDGVEKRGNDCDTCQLIEEIEAYLVTDSQNTPIKSQVIAIGDKWLTEGQDQPWGAMMEDLADRLEAGGVLRSE